MMLRNLRERSLRPGQILVVFENKFQSRGTILFKLTNLMKCEKSLPLTL